MTQKHGGIDREAETQGMPEERHLRAAANLVAPLQSYPPLSSADLRNIAKNNWHDRELCGMIQRVAQRLQSDATLLSEAQARIQELEGENAKQKAALEVYANKNNWDKETAQPWTAKIVFDYQGTGKHGYELAQQALKSKD